MPLPPYANSPNKVHFLMAAEWHPIHPTTAGPGVLSLSQVPSPQHILCSACLSLRNNLWCLSSLTGVHLLAMIKY